MAKWGGGGFLHDTPLSHHSPFIAAPFHGTLLHSTPSPPFHRPTTSQDSTTLRMAPPLDRMTDTRLRKHYLAANTVAGGKNHAALLNIGVVQGRSFYTYHSCPVRAAPVSRCTPVRPAPASVYSGKSQRFPCALRGSVDRS